MAKTKSRLIDKLLKKHGYNIRELMTEVNRVTGNKFSAGQFAGERKLAPSKRLLKALRQINRGDTIRNRRLRKKTTVKKQLDKIKKIKKRAKPVKRLKTSKRKKKDLRKQSLRKPLRLRRFIIDTSCETDSFSPYRHQTFYVYYGKLGKLKGIKASGVRRHNLVFFTHEILEIHGIEEIK